MLNTEENIKVIEGTVDIGISLTMNKIIHKQKDLQQTY